MRDTAVEASAPAPTEDADTPSDGGDAEPARPGGGRVDAKTLVVLGATLLLWSSAFAAIGAGLRAYSAGHLVLLRFLVAVAALMLYAVPARVRTPERRDVPAIFLLALLGFTIYHVALVFGQRSVDAGTASLLVATSPAMTALAAGIFLRERLKPLGWVGIAISFAGAALIAFGKSGGLRFEPGALLILMGAFTISLYNVFQKPYLRRYRALDLTTYAVCLGTLPMLVYLPGLVPAIAAAPLSATLAVVYLGVFPLAVGYVGWSYALSRAPASIVVSFLYLSTPMAVLIAWAWLGQVPASISLLGGAIVLSGVILVNTRGR